MLSRCLCHFLSLPRSISDSLTIGTVIADDDDDCCVILFTFSVSYLFCISFAVTFLSVVVVVVVVFCEGEVTALLYSALTAAAVCSFSVGQMGNSCCCCCCCFAFCLSLSFVNCSSFFTNGLEHLLFVLHSLLLALPSFGSALVALYFAFFRQERRRDCCQSKGRVKINRNKKYNLTNTTPGLGTHTRRAHTLVQYLSQKKNVKINRASFNLIYLFF